MRSALTLLALLAACSRDAPPGPARPASAPSREPTWGEPDMPRMRELFRARASQVRACYDAALLREPTTTGRFTLRFTIVPGGAIEDVSFEGSTFRRRDVPRCVADVVRGWKTPFRPAEPVAIEYPLRFTPM